MSEILNTTRRFALRALSFGSAALALPLAAHASQPTPKPATEEAAWWYAGDGWYESKVHAWPGRVQISRAPDLDLHGERFCRVRNESGKIVGLATERLGFGWLTPANV